MPDENLPAEGAADAKKSELEASAAEIGRQIGELEVKARQAGADVQKEIEAAVRDLQARSDDLQVKLKELSTASQAAWAEMASGAEAALDELKQAYSRAAAHFK